MRVTPSGAVILAFHNVVEDGTTLKPGVDELTVTETQLRTHLRILRAMRITVVDVSHIAQLVANRECPSGLAAITFDDALAGVDRVALPVLAEAGVKGTIFVPTDNPGDAPAFWPGAEPTMTTDQLRGAVKAGHTLGSHTATHRSLITLEPIEVELELSRSKAALEESTQKAVVAMAYPSGHHTPSVRTAVAAAGYRSACTFLNGRTTADVDRFRLPRLTMGAHSSAGRFLYHLLRPARTWPDHQLDRVEAS